MTTGCFILTQLISENSKTSEIKIYPIFVHAQAKFCIQHVFVDDLVTPNSNEDIFQCCSFCKHNQLIQFPDNTLSLQLN